MNRNTYNKVLNVNQVAQLTGLTKPAIYKAMNKGVLPMFVNGRGLVVTTLEFVMKWRLS
jgi:DNA-binding phage protein